MQDEDALSPTAGIVHHDFMDATALMNAEVYELVKNVSVRVKFLGSPMAPLSAPARAAHSSATNRSSRLSIRRSSTSRLSGSTRICGCAALRCCVAPNRTSARSETPSRPSESHSSRRAW